MYYTVSLVSKTIKHIHGKHNTDNNIIKSVTVATGIEGTLLKVGVYGFYNEKIVKINMIGL